jgi:uncharacterized protein (UPF0548 family)
MMQVSCHTSGVTSSGGAVFRVTRPSATELEALLEAARASEPSYPAIGSTRETVPAPAGFRHDETSRMITGSQAFERARQGLQTWQTHLGAGADVFPRVFGPDDTVIVILGLGPMHVLAFCRIIYVIDEPDRFGFAYGSLPGHPEQGEEAFVAERSGPTAVRFVIRAFSRPAEPLVKVTAPIARIIQKRMTVSYLQALERYIQST